MIHKKRILDMKLGMIHEPINSEENIQWNKGIRACMVSYIQGLFRDKEISIEEYRELEKIIHEEYIPNNERGIELMNNLRKK
jgi:hypothetical protein